MTLEDLGYNKELENYRRSENLDSFGVGRIILVHKERYIVKTAEKEYDGMISGNMRNAAQSNSDFPAVGDWVAISEYDKHKVLIHSIFPRKTTIERQIVGKRAEKQIISTNVDYAFIVQAVDRDFNINRLERFLTIINTSNVSPIIVLNKIDLVTENKLSKLVHQVRERISNVPILPISNESHKGLTKLKETIIKGKTYCLLGSSGVGKSTLLNNISGKQLMKTDTISTSTNKGRHVTSHRELIVLENGGILIDNPGIREVGILDSNEGLEITFNEIIEFSRDCRFNDCSHIIEIDCAVIKAVERGDLEKTSYDNFLKMEREKEHYKSSVAEKRKKDKDFGEMVKRHKKDHFKDKY